MPPIKAISQPDLIGAYISALEEVRVKRGSTLISFAHDVAFIALGAMLFVHVYLSVIHPLMRPLATGAWSSMARGKVSAEYAKAHHGKWYARVSKGMKESPSADK